MSSLFAVGKHAFGFCDRCGFRYPLGELRAEVVDFAKTSVRVCPTCWDPDQPQNHLGQVDVTGPQALENPRPDLAQEASRFGVSIRYDFETDQDYFVPFGGSTTVVWQSDKTILFTGGNTDSRLIRSGRDPSISDSFAVSIDTSIYNRVQCRLRLINPPVPSGIWDGSFCWVRSGDAAGDWQGSRCVDVEEPDWFTMGDQWHLLNWDFREPKYPYGYWTGTVVEVRFDFFGFTSPPSTAPVVEIDYIRFESGTEQT